MRPEPWLVWSVGLFTVTIVSCCSLIGVCIVPLISGKSYKVFITLFTGLAVGSLVGSAIFSLIPQAFNLHLQPNKAYLWKSLMIFFGIYLFYLSERLMRIYFNRKFRKLEPKEIVNDNEENSNNAHSTNAPSKFNHAGDSHAMTEVNLQKNETEKCPLKEVKKTIGNQVDSNHQLYHHAHLDTQEVLAKALTKRSKQVKKEIAPVAWMIIIGDGLHNFIDGLSIGAAFSESIVLGASTSVAVIFEEFPHELGDFAVLISSGMSVRQALGFNFLSACTCYIGMVFGILLGDLTQSASFIFALAGGMFLYISLVDMMGELSAMLEESESSIRETSKLLLMQNIGILSGIMIIFGLSWVNFG